MKTYKQAREILELLTTWHERVQEYCERLSAETGRERVQMLIDYVEKREQQLSDSLENYAGKHSEDLLETWFQYVPAIEHLEGILSTKPKADMSVDQVVEEVLEIDDAFCEFYRQLATRTDSEEVTTLFEQLAIQQEAEKAELKKTAQQLKHGV